MILIGHVIVMYVRNGVVTVIMIGIMIGGQTIIIGGHTIVVVSGNANPILMDVMGDCIWRGSVIVEENGLL